MKCTHCGYDSQGQFNVCPACGQIMTPNAAPPQGNSYAQTNVPQNSTYAQGTAYSQGVPYPQAGTYSQPGAVPNYYTTQTVTQPQTGMTGGERVAIGTAIVVSILSVLTAFFIFVGYAVASSEKSSNDTDEEFGIDAIDDFDSNDYLDDFFKDFYKQYQDNEAFSTVSPADLHTPVEFTDDFYSFSDGFINTRYTVEMEETYRSDAALKLLEGTALPTLTSEQEIYLVKFKVTVTDQDKEALVTFTKPTFNAAYKAEANGELGEEYTVLSNLSLKDDRKMMTKGDEGERWLAFVIDKNDDAPLVLWDKYEESYFRSTQTAVTNAAGLTAGGALEAAE